MQFLRRLISDSNEADIKEEAEPVYELSQEKHDGAYPIVARKIELEAFAQMLSEYVDTPWPGQNSIVAESVDGAYQNITDDSKTVDESLEEYGQRAEAIISLWKEQVRGDMGVVYAPIGVHFRLNSIFELCESRHENEVDNFSLPSDVNPISDLVKRVKQADIHDGSTYAIVPDDVTPELE